MSQNYEKSKVAVDPVIFTIHQGKLKVLLHTREKEPDQGKLELPGGLLLPDETAEATLRRKLQELIGHHRIFFRHFFTFTEPERDARGRTVSIGFLALIDEDKLNDVLHWHDYDALSGLAFDHSKIIRKAHQYLKENLSAPIVKEFMPTIFPLNKLQAIYEMIEEKEHDNRNFRKKMISSGIVEETKQMEENVSHRPARLFRFKE